MGENGTSHPVGKVAKVKINPPLGIYGRTGETKPSEIRSPNDEKGGDNNMDGERAL